MSADVSLEVKNLTKRFGGLVAVKDISLNIRRGEILGLIGPNGSGKTTFFNVTTGIYRADAGHIGGARYRVCAEDVVDGAESVLGAYEVGEGFVEEVHVDGHVYYGA